jgi:hypothetical protein
MTYQQHDASMCYIPKVEHKSRKVISSVFKIIFYILVIVRASGAPKSKNCGEVLDDLTSSSRELVQERGACWWSIQLAQ